MSASRRLLGACLRASGLQHHAAMPSTSAAGLMATQERHWHALAHETEQQQQQQPSASFGGHLSSSLAVQGLLGRAPSSSSLHLAPQPLGLLQHSRGLATLSSSPRRRAGSVPVGLGLGLQPRGSCAPALPGARTFITEGQVMGTTFLVATDIMFWSGLIGAVVFRRNLIVMLLATEIVMLACNLNFLFASAYFNDMTGVIMSITITTIAACETAIGLALCVTYFHLRSATDVEVLNFLK